MKKFVKGDFEGLFALGLDNMLMFILMSSLCQGFLGFSEELFYGRILPAAAVGLIIGNIFYAHQALKLAKKEGRNDVCAIPYGTSLLTIIVYVFLIMFPAQQKALADGLSKEEADIIAWHAGLIGCFGSGFIEFFGSFVAQYLRRVTPRAALLVAIGGTGLAFISMDFVFRAYAFPVIGFTTLALVFVFFFGGVKNKLGLPGGFIVLATGTAIAWSMYWMDLPTVVPAGEINTAQIGLKMPIPVIGDLAKSFRYLMEFLPIIIPMGFILLVSSLQNIESAAAAGDSYNPRPCMAFNGLGTLGAAFFGSPFPTSIFLGHPGYKKMGARAGYSTLNAIVWSVICFTGTLSFVVFLIPVEAGMAILIWIGVVMCSQCFQATERKHAPAVVVGLIPAIAAYVALAVKHTLAVASAETGQALFRPEINETFVQMRTFYTDGMFAIGQGYIYTCMVMAAATVCIIDRKFKHAGIWFLIGAVFSLIGFTNTYLFTEGDVIGLLSINFSKWTLGYLIMALVMFVTPYLTVPVDEEPEQEPASSKE